MSQIQTDQQVSKIRGALFPFFDVQEILFVVFILVSEFILIHFLRIQNGWAILSGSYAGILGMGWMAVPSNLVINSGDLPRVRAILSTNLLEVGPSRFVPKLPWVFRWPRNAITLHEDSRVWLSGPRILLEGVHREIAPDA